MPTLYGIANCDSVKKAQKWLKTHEIDYKFHDFRKDGLQETQLAKWLECVATKELDLKTLINKRSTTWKQLPDTLKDSLSAQMNGENPINDSQVINTLLEHPTLIKRPLLELNESIQLGFSETLYAGLLK